MCDRIRQVLLNLLYLYMIHEKHICTSNELEFNHLICPTGLSKDIKELSFFYKIVKLQMCNFYILSVFSFPEGKSPLANFKE